MKKASFLFLAVLFISSGSLFAQGFHLGVKGGVNMSQLQGGESFSNGFKLGLSGGAFAELNFNKHIGLQPEL